MAALWPSLMWLPVLETFYHAKTGVQKDFTMKHCLGEIMGGKAHKMIIQYMCPTNICMSQVRIRYWRLCNLETSVVIRTTSITTNFDIFELGPVSVSYNHGQWSESDPKNSTPPPPAGRPSWSRGQPATQPGDPRGSPRIQGEDRPNKDGVNMVSFSDQIGGGPLTSGGLF